MKQIKVGDKTFEVSLPADTIQSRVKALAVAIENDLAGKNPFFIVVLNGAFLFAADIFRNMTTPCEIGFIRVSSYSGMSSTGEVKSVMGIEQSLEGRHVVILEDIVDSGYTAVFLMEQLKSKNVASVRFATLLFKPNALRHDFKPDYTGFEVPNDFLVGYGLDYDGYGRNYNEIYKLYS